MQTVTQTHTTETSAMIPVQQIADSLEFVRSNDGLLRERLERVYLRNESTLSRTQKTAINYYIDHMERINHEWFEPDLRGYKQWLLRGKDKPVKESTAKHYLSNVRCMSRRLLKDRRLRQEVRIAIAAQMRANGQKADPANVKAKLDELYLEMAMELDPDNKDVKIKETTTQEKPDSQFLWLEPEQARELVNAPFLDRANGRPVKVRDRAILALLLVTGLRAQELLDLTVSDLFETYQGHAAVWVRHGKGNKERMVLFGANEFVLNTYVTQWLELAGLRDKPDEYAFPHVWKGGRVEWVEEQKDDKVEKRTMPLTYDGLRYIINKYRVTDNGKPREVCLHDLRRSCAQAWLDSGMPIKAIQKQLGHASRKTTWRYLKPVGAEERLVTVDMYGLNPT